MSKIVLTTDLSDESKRAFAPTVEMAQKLGLGIVLVHVVSDYKAVPHGAPLAPAQSSPETAAAVREAKAQIEALRIDLGGDATAEVLTGDDVAETIVDYANKIGAAYIAIATHGRTGFRHLVLGSVAEDVLRHAHVPVVSYPLAKSS